MARQGIRALLLAARLAAWLLVAIGSPASAAPDPAQLCDRAAAQAARRSGVPLDVMLAITRTETGRAGPHGVTPWPWTVNMEGLGRWFATEAEARDYVIGAYEDGARSFDIGCFQINHRWHGSAFASIEEMFDPELNAAYAARFLARLHAETGDWGRAAGAYHSRTPAYAERYAARFETMRGEIGTDQTVLPARASFGPPQALALGVGLAGGPLIVLAAGRSAAGQRGSLMPPPEVRTGLAGPLVRMD